VKHQIKILREVYFDTLKYADAQGYPSNLRGLCSIAAYELSRRLRRAGFKADFTIGTYTGVPHCWVVTKTEIFDPTVLQFTYAAAQDSPEWSAMRRDLGDRCYVEECSGVKAVRTLDSEWSDNPRRLTTWKSAISNVVGKSATCV
jgi:hypothetical protein